MKRIALITSVLLSTSAVHAVSVDIELSLLVDRSSSVDASEYERQRLGYRNAFQNLNFEATVGAGHSVAVNYVEWSALGDQQVRSNDAAHPDGWWLLTSQADCNAFAAMLNSLTFIAGTSTAPQDALMFAVSDSGGRMFSNGYESTKQIIDVSGDGASNSGLSGTMGRDAALAAGVDVINGLVIGNELNAFTYYNTNVRSANGFVLQAADFDAFSSAITEKLRLELTSAVPLPGAAAMGLMGLCLVAGVRRRTRA